jgi:3-mercaptopyruvate sulfurtransferase SseA
MYGPEEFTQGHIDDAVNVNWLRQFCCRRKKFDKTKPFLYIVKVETEVKGNWKAQWIRVQNIYELEGGFMKWSDEGLNNAKNKILKYIEVNELIIKTKKWYFIVVPCVMPL